MKILDVSVDWRFEWANEPNCVVTVDKIPRDLVYKKHVTGDRNQFTAYWAEQDGYVNFFLSTPDKTGYGGRTFTPKLEDGTVDNVKGPWSSNSSSMSQWFPESVGVSIYEIEGDYPKLGYGGAMLVDTLVLALRKFQPDVVLSYQNLGWAMGNVPILWTNKCTHPSLVCTLCKGYGVESTRYFTRECWRCHGKGFSPLGRNSRCATCNHKIYPEDRPIAPVTGGVDLSEDQAGVVYA